MLMFWGFIFISVLGTIGHYIYDWSNQNEFLAYFFAKNESTFEHMKLLVFPSILWTIISYFFIGDNCNFWNSQALSLIIMLLLIPTLFYGSKLFIKKDIFIIDIAIFYISIFVGLYFGNYVLNIYCLPALYSYISIFILIIIPLLFAYFSKAPLNNFLFIDPVKEKMNL